MSQLIVQIYKLSRTALKTKARVVKVNHDLLHNVLQVNQISHWNPREKTVWHPRFVRGAVHSGIKWRWLAKWCKIHKVYIHSHSMLLLVFTNIFIHIQQPNLHSRNIFIHIYLCISYSRLYLLTFARCPHSHSTSYIHSHSLSKYSFSIFCVPPLRIGQYKTWTADYSSAGKSRLKQQIPNVKSITKRWRYFVDFLHDFESFYFPKRFIYLRGIAFSGPYRWNFRKARDLFILLTLYCA